MGAFTGFTGLEFDQMRGFMSFPRVEDVPSNFASVAINVRFRPGSVETRPGLASLATGGLAVGGLNGIAQYINNAGTTILTLAVNADGYLVFDNAGSFGPITPEYLIATRIVTAGARMRGVLQFDRLFLGFYIAGTDVAPAGPIRYYDGTDLLVLSPSGPGAAPSVVDSAAAGLIPAGTHKLAVLFETKDGRYLTELSPTVSWNAAGSKKATVSNIPTGPPSYVVARRLVFTAVNGEDFFYLTTFRIPDNTTTSLDIDFDDDSLQRGESYNQYFDHFRLPDATGIAFYRNRAVVWGCLNTIKFRNLDFDGGFAVTGEPLGWTQGAGFTGGSKGTSLPFSGEYWRILGDGGAGDRGEILNGEAATLLKPNTSYTVSARIRKSSAGLVVSEKLTIDLQSTTGAIDTTGIELTASQVTDDWIEYTGVLTSGLATIPADLKLRVFYDHVVVNLPNLEGFHIDRIQVWPTNKKFEASTLRISDTDQPERFDGTSGFQSIKKDNGQPITAARENRGFLYVGKTHSTHILEDDGVNAPSLWGTREISSSIGAFGPNAIDGTEAFIIMAGHAGMYLFRGPSGMRLSLEIQPTWNTISAAYASRSHIVVDPKQQLVYCYVPFSGFTDPVSALVLDYSRGWGTDEDPGGRDWEQDIVGFPVSFIAGSVLALNDENKLEPWFVGMVIGGNPQLVRYSGLRDISASVDAQYATAYRKVRGDIGGQDLFGGVTLIIAGSAPIDGTHPNGIQTTLFASDGGQQILANSALSPSSGKEVSLIANLEGDRARILVRCFDLDSWFQLKKITLWTQEWATARPM